MSVPNLAPDRVRARVCSLIVDNSACTLPIASQPLQLRSYSVRCILGFPTSAASGSVAGVQQGSFAVWLRQPSSFLRCCFGHERSFGVATSSQPNTGWQLTSGSVSFRFHWQSFIAASTLEGYFHRS